MAQMNSLMKLMSAAQLKADKKEDKGVNPNSKADMAEDMASIHQNTGMSSLSKLLKAKKSKKNKGSK